MDDASREFVSRYFMKMRRVPNSLQAVDYSVVSSYTKTVAAAGMDNPDKVIVRSRKIRVDNFYVKGCIHQDNRTIHGMYLLRVKTPTESKKSWDYLEIIMTAPGE